MLSWLVAMCLWASPAALRAQMAAPSQRILLTVAAPADEARQLEAVARELLARLAVQLELRRVQRVDLREIRHRAAPGQVYFARVWIDFAQSGRARLYLEHAESDRLLVRDVAADSSNPELMREELGHILQATIEGLKAGEEIGAPRDEALQQVEAEDATATASAPGAAERPAPPATPGPRRHGFRFGPRYEAVWLGDASALEDGPGAVFGWVELRARLGLELAGYYRRPLELRADPVGVRLQTLALRALVTFDAWRSRRSVLRLAAGAGADLVRVSPLDGSARDVELAPARWLKLALGRVTVSYAHQLASFVAVELNLGADLDPARTRYVYQRSDGDAAVLEPWPVRPLLSLGATVL